MSAGRPALRVLVSCAFLVVSGVPLSAAGRLVTFSSADGTSLAGMLYEASNRPAPAVVLVHMLGRSKDEWIPFADRLQEVGFMVLALDLRGHGGSAGNGGVLTAMSADVRAAVDWLTARPGVRPGALAVVGASLGANLAALAAVDAPAVRALGLLSPSLDYRGLRLDGATMKKLGDRPVWMAASTEDPYALRTVKELSSENAVVEQRLSRARAHGTSLLLADQEVVLGLVDWLRRTLIL